MKTENKIMYRDDFNDGWVVENNGKKYYIRDIDPSCHPDEQGWWIAIAKTYENEDEVIRVIWTDIPSLSELCQTSMIKSWIDNGIISKL